MDELIAELIKQGPVVAAFVFFALQMRKAEDKRAESSEKAEDKRAKSSDKILGDVLKQDSIRDAEWRAFLLEMRREQVEREKQRDEELRDREKEWQQFLSEERTKYNATLSDNTTVMHQVMAMFERITKLFEELNR